MNTLRRKRIRCLKRRLSYKKSVAEVKATLHANSNSLIWVWEFSKKAVLLCFAFYVATQIYAMTVMIVYCDFSYLGDLIRQAGELVRDCVFGYLIKAGLENVGKIWFRNHYTSEDEPEG